MTVDDSKNLKEGNIVYWRGDAADSGTITETRSKSVTINWKNGKPAIARHGDMREIQRVPAKPVTVQGKPSIPR